MPVANAWPLWLALIFRCYMINTTSTASLNSTSDRRMLCLTWLLKVTRPFKPDCEDVSDSQKTQPCSLLGAVLCGRVHGT